MVSEVGGSLVGLILVGSSLAFETNININQTENMLSMSLQWVVLICMSKIINQDRNGEMVKAIQRKLATSVEGKITYGWLSSFIQFNKG